MFKTDLKSKVSEYIKGIDFEVLIPPNPELGDYSINAAFVLAKKEKKNPKEVAEDIIKKLKEDDWFSERFEKIEFANPGFINFYFQPSFLQRIILEVSKEKDYGCNQDFKGQKVMVEYTDPNPFKLFHIGHLMSNAIGESIARIYEASGAKTLRVNYQGDVGLHVAKAILGWIILKAEGINPKESLLEKVNFLGQCYALGSAESFAWLKINDFGLDESIIDKRNDLIEKGELDRINKAIYEKSDPEIEVLYDLGKKWSLEYFETIYKRLGTKFDHYFFESEAGPAGTEIVKKHPEVFTESDGAIVFKGDEHGLHTRVFINSQGLPTYEAKELGLNKKKFDEHSLDLSLIVTGNEINEYFKVLLKVMELVMPEVAEKTKHVGHGMMRLATGKMSSRTGDVITAEWLIKETMEKLKEKSGPEPDEKITIGAIKYSILKQSPGQDIIFDFDSSLSVKGDSGVYLQYTYARLNNILLKSSEDTSGADVSKLDKGEELAVIKKILEFSDVIKESRNHISPNRLSLYVYELASLANQFYEKVRVLDDLDASRQKARLVLIQTTNRVLKKGLYILGIETLEKI